MVHFRNSSNYLTIAEVRFDRVENVAQHLPTIQAALRVAKYIEATTVKSQTLNVEQIDQRQVLVPTVHNTYEHTEPSCS